MRKRLMSTVVAVAALTMLGCAESTAPDPLATPAPSPSTDVASSDTDATAETSEDPASGTETLLVTLDVPNMV